MPRWLNRHRWLGVVVVLGVLAVTAAACSSSSNETSTSPSGSAKAAKTQALAAMFFPESGRVALREAIEQKIIDKFLFVDGTKDQTMFDDVGAANFEGMYGTAPGAADETAGAKLDAAYQAYGGKVGSIYIREGYDATYLIALAAVAANSSDPKAIRDNLRAIANPPGEKIGFGTDEFKKAVNLLKQGKDIDYSGAAGPDDLDVNGDVARGAIEVWQIKQGKIGTVRTEPVDLASQTGVAVPTPAPSPAATTPTTPLKIGEVMSQTGDLSDYGPPISKAIQMAADEINAAGGVWGQPVQVVVRDDATNPDQGQAAARQLIDVDHVQAIIGALSSGVTLPIAENVTGPAGVLQISPASTSPALSTAKDNDFLFRDVISDAAQGVVLADVAYNTAHFTSVCTLYVNTPYGQGLSEQFTKAFEKLGGTVPNQVPIEQSQTTYAAELRKCVGG